MAKMDAAGSPQYLDISPESLKRRSKVLPGDRLIDDSDIPVSGRYLDNLRQMGFRPRAISRWLNAVSVRMTDEQKQVIEKLDFVRQVRQIHAYRKPDPVTSAFVDPVILKRAQSGMHLFDYGSSYTQNEICRIPEIHDLGLTGKNVIVGMLDSGFSFRNRPVFKHLKVLEEYDFLDNDSVTSNSSMDIPDQHNHGTQVLSVLAGYMEGELIGPAFGASYLLSKTESVLLSDEWFEIENWVEGIEWLERRGAQIVNSSLGYRIFVDTVDYAYSDMDGNTSVATIAADMAVGKGMVVVTSAGNRNFDDHIDSPADGDSVIAVGAVNINRNLANFSSLGPTADGRIKPDVMAMGVGVYGINPRIYENQYVYANGTSLSSPMIAGICALILEARPELTPMEIREALRNTASQAGSPDTLFGWGIADAYEALFYHGMVFTGFNIIQRIDLSDNVFEVMAFSNTGIDPASVRLHYLLPGVSDMFVVTAMMLRRSASGYCFSAAIPKFDETESFRFYMTARDSTGQQHAGPIHAPDMVYTFLPYHDNEIRVGPFVPDVFCLYQNFPNPFNQMTHILFDLSIDSHVRLRIFNARGREVAKLLDEVCRKGQIEVSWNGKNSGGTDAGAGVYIAVLEAEKHRRSIKMIHLP